MNKEVLLRAAENMAAGIPSELAVIAFTMGSSPGKRGDAMLIAQNGEQAGTVGGGLLEFESTKLCLEYINEKKSLVRTFELDSEKAGAIGMICGGQDTLLYQYLDPEDTQTRETLEEAARLIREDVRFWMLFTNSAAYPGRIGIMSAEQADKLGGPGDDADRIVFDESDGDYVLSVPVKNRDRVVIYGGGHIAQEVAPLLAHLDFAVTVIDDSGEYANQENFPEADRILITDFAGAAELLKIGPDDYAVIMTRGHKSDYTAESELLPRQPKYLGVIGSRRKTEKLNEKLRADGFSDETLDSVYTPIGLDIGAKTPAEIAVSIAAELIQVRAKQRQGCSCCGGC